MDSAKIAEANIDYETGCKRFANKSALFEKYLMRLPADPSCQQANEALAKQELQAAYVAIHTLKGVSGNLSVTKLYELCCVVCDHYKAGDTSNMEAEIAAVTAEFERVSALLKEA